MNCLKIIRIGFLVKFFKEVDSVFVNIFLESLLVERLKQKSIELKILLDKNQNDWEETFYQILCRSFGYKVNAEPMFYLAKSLPFKILSKHSNDLFQLEALFFGVSGFLKEANDQYSLSLKNEFSFLSKKI